MKTIRISPCDSEYMGLVVADKIVRLSKSECGEITYIHLSNREVVPCKDSINRLEAKLELLD